MKTNRLLEIRNLFWAVLVPLSFVWSFWMWIRRSCYPAQKKNPIPVFCVGSIQSGGSGKTPILLELVEHFRSQNPVIVSRGYRSLSESKNVQLDLSDANGPRSFGDEPWMVAKRTKVPVWVGKNRRASLQKIVDSKAGKLVFLDDGFQHLKLFRDLDLVVLNGEARPEDSFCHPAGHLRENISALRYASAVVVTKADGSDVDLRWKALLKDLFPNLSVFSAVRKVDDSELRANAFRSLGAFCGIASPERFFENIGRIQKLTLKKIFPDHYCYPERSVRELMSLGKGLGVEGWVTTEKDWYKVEVMFSEAGVPLVSLRIRYEFSPDFWYFVESAVNKMMKDQ